MTSRHLQAAILAAVLCVAALPAGAAVIRLGDIRLAYDPERWELGDETGASTFGDIPPAAIRLSCKLPACSNRSGQAAVWIRVTAGETASCRGIVEAEEWPISTLPRTPPGGQDFGGLIMHVWTTHSACRARTPAHLEACGMHGGSIYTLGSGAHFGCSGIEGVPMEMFTELLSGISLADKVPRPDPN